MATAGLPDDDHFEIEVDQDKDSALGSDVSAYTETLRSSLLETVKENGRGYHKYRDGAYILPADEQEQRRLDIQHEMFMRTFENKLVLAPIEDDVVRNVLDLGTGTGLWAIEFADEHPMACVIGTDLAAMQPTILPPNCKFEVDDFEGPWTWPQKFDLIHGRMLDCSFADGKRLFQQAYDALEPGGWIEFQDASMPLQADDGTMDGTILEDWVHKFTDAMNKIGRDAAAPEQYEQWARDVGFVNVSRQNFKWPQNPWPKDPFLKELGRWHLINTLDGIQGFTVRPFTAILGMSLEEVEVYLVQLRKDIANRHIHCYWPIIVVYGQKPRQARPAS